MVLYVTVCKSGVADKYVRVVQDMYKDCETLSTCVVGVTDGFQVGGGFSFGSLLMIHGP